MYLIMTFPFVQNTSLTHQIYNGIILRHDKELVKIGDLDPRVIGSASVQFENNFDIQLSHELVIKFLPKFTLVHNLDRMYIELFTF